MAHAPRPSPESRTQSHDRMVPQELSPPRAAKAPQELREDKGPLLILDGCDSEEKTDPRAEGACFFDLTSEEWQFVRNAPLVGFLIVAGADGTVLPEERRALVSVLEQGKRSTSEVFQAVCRELYRQRDRLPALFVSDTFEREQLSEAYRLVMRKLGEEEAERFRTCVLKLGWQVAKASGGLAASLGWLRGVEQRALAELAGELGTHI